MNFYLYKLTLASFIPTHTHSTYPPLPSPSHSHIPPPPPPYMRTCNRHHPLPTHTLPHTHHHTLPQRSNLLSNSSQYGHHDTTTQDLTSSISSELEQPGTLAPTHTHISIKEPFILMLCCCILS